MDQLHKSFETEGHPAGKFSTFSREICRSWVDVWKPGNVMTVGPERENMSGKHRHISV